MHGKRVTFVSETKVFTELFLGGWVYNHFNIKESKKLLNRKVVAIVNY